MSIKGLMSSEVPHLAEPYSTPFLYFLTFLPFKYTIPFIVTAPQKPMRISKGCRLGKGSFPKLAKPFKESITFKKISI